MRFILQLRTFLNDVMWDLTSRTQGSWKGSKQGCDPTGFPFLKEQNHRVASSGSHVWDGPGASPCSLICEMDLKSSGLPGLLRRIQDTMSMKPVAPGTWLAMGAAQCSFPPALHTRALSSGRPTSQFSGSLQPFWTTVTPPLLTGSRLLEPVV